MNSFIKILLVSVVLAAIACSGGSGGGSAGPGQNAKPDGKSGQSTVDYPRTFSGSLELLNQRTGNRVSASSYDKDSKDSLLGCVESSDGKDFTFVMKNSDSWPDDLKIQIHNAYFRENKSNYDLDDVKLDGYTRNKWFEFDSSKQTYQTTKCEAKVERVKDYAKGFFQCHYVNPLKNPDNTQMAMVLNFSCDIVKN